MGCEVYPPLAAPEATRGPQPSKPGYNAMQTAFVSV